jgi:hypothetical protein
VPEEEDIPLDEGGGGGEGEGDRAF